jgi:[ribosomal protein S18]-alanine N-acetyltransferase
LPSVFIAVNAKITMMTSASITLTPLERQHRRAVDELLFHSDQVHTHLDWYEPVEWLSQYSVPVRLAWHGKRLAGLLAVSRPLNGASWMRIAALDNYGPAHTIFPALWHDLLLELRGLEIETVSLLVMRPWIKSYLRELHFDFVEDVVTLERNGTHLPEPPATPVLIRHLEAADLLRAARIDQAAFGPPWHMTFEEVRQASRIAEICTVAECSGQIAGYQISTLYRSGAHLARLAVDPVYQGQGIGSALLYDLLRRLIQRRLTTITVNTQASNLRSQRLYQRFGFQRNGYDLPVWRYSLPR